MAFGRWCALFFDELLHSHVDRMPNPSSDQLVWVGTVIRAHGVRGELKVYPETDDPTRLFDLQQVYLGLSVEKVTAYPVTSVRTMIAKRKTQIVLALAGIGSREGAEALRARKVYALEDELPEMDEDDFFLDDLIGLSVVTDAGEPIGTMRDYLELPTYDVYIVTRPGQPEAMIPAVPEFIEAIDWDAEQIVVKPIDGLLNDATDSEREVPDAD
ncbi:MAG: ribosome maturation factor RimM [Rhodothermales bacterium]